MWKLIIFVHPLSCWLEFDPCSVCHMVMLLGPVRWLHECSFIALCAHIEAAGMCVCVLCTTESFTLQRRSPSSLPKVFPCTAEPTRATKSRRVPWETEGKNRIMPPLFQQREKKKRKSTRALADTQTHPGDTWELHAAMNLLFDSWWALICAAPLATFEVKMSATLASRFHPFTLWANRLTEQAVLACWVWIPECETAHRKSRRLLRMYAPSFLHQRQAEPKFVPAVKLGLL